MSKIIDELAKLAAKCAENDEAVVESPYRRAEDYIAAIAEYLDEGGSGGGGSFSPDISAPQDGDTLLYNASQEKWVNGAGGGGGGALLVHDVDGTLDKTYAEIVAAIQNNLVYKLTYNESFNSYSVNLLQNYGFYNGTYALGFVNEDEAYFAESENDYPAYPSDPIG